MVDKIAVVVETLEQSIVVQQYGLANGYIWGSGDRFVRKEHFNCYIYLVIESVVGKTAKFIRHGHLRFKSAEECEYMTYQEFVGKKLRKTRIQNFLESDV
jgi:hypothetical protein